MRQKKVTLRFAKKFLLSCGLDRLCAWCLLCYLCITQTEVVLFSLQLLFVKLCCVFGCWQNKKDGTLPQRLESKCGKQQPCQSSCGEKSDHFCVLLPCVMGESVVPQPQQQTPGCSALVLRVIPLGQSKVKAIGLGHSKLNETRKLSIWIHMSLYKTFHMDPRTHKDTSIVSQRTWF